MRPAVNLVSIIIPCYNYGRYLGEAIESAIGQTYHPIEIIVVNDGSTDNTIQVASQYPVSLFNQENRGASATFNQGIDLAKGEYIIILSADDKLGPQFVEKTVNLIQKNPDASFVYTHAYMFGIRRGKILGRPYNINTLKRANYIFGTALIRRDAFRSGIKFDSSLSCLEDYDLWLAFAEHGLRGMLLPEPLFYYRQQTQSRNRFTNWRFRRTMMRIWKKHHRLYTQGEIFRIIMLGRAIVISVAVLDFMEKIFPYSLQVKIRNIKNKIRYSHGCIIVEEQNVLTK